MPEGGLAGGRPKFWNCDIFIKGTPPKIGCWPLFVSSKMFYPHEGMHFSQSKIALLLNLFSQIIIYGVINVECITNINHVLCLDSLELGTNGIGNNLLLTVHEK